MPVPLIGRARFRLAADGALGGELSPAGRNGHVAGADGAAALAWHATVQLGNDDGRSLRLEWSRR